MEFHPLANIFPLIEGAEFEALVDDIKQNGLYETIVTLDNMILDGRNRWRACKAAQVPARFEPFTGDNPLGYVISLNLKRRHLNESQRAMVADRLANMPKGRPSNNAQICALNIVPQEQAAKLLNVSRRSVQSARELRQKAPELAQCVEQGKETLHNALKTIKAEERKIARETVPADFPDVGDRYRLITGDFRTAAIEPNTIDAIITDPPYPKEHIHLYGALASKAAEWLKPGGSLVAMAGQSYLPEIFKEMEGKGLTYNWTLDYRMPTGPSLAIHSRHIQNNQWKPVLWYVKGELDSLIRPNTDVVISEKSDKEHHHWGQSVSGFDELVRMFSKAGDMVLDPFMGGGTTAICALKQNRKCIGIEIEQKAFNTSKARIAELEASENKAQAA
jgi:16S rRNA G966 N2-methylase RsmD